MLSARIRRPEDQVARDADARAPAPSRAAPALSRELAAAVGNRAFSDLVARRPVLTRQDAGTAAAPERVRTEFGYFDVYPDAAESVPVAEPGRTKVWPIRESAFAALQDFMASIDSWSEPSALRILAAEDEMFEPTVKLDLAWLQTQPVGGELLAAMAKTGKQVFIQWYPDDNMTVYPKNEDDSYLRESGEPGPGTNAKIKYNPQRLKIHDGTEPWMKRPPAIGLAHELVHAWTAMTGTRARGNVGDDEKSELQATGLGEFEDALFTENRFREAFRLPPRPRL